MRRRDPRSRPSWPVIGPHGSGEDRVPREDSRSGGERIEVGARVNVNGDPDDTIEVGHPQEI